MRLRLVLALAHILHMKYIVINQECIMNKIGTTTKGYNVYAINPGQESPMANHKGGEIAVDEKTKSMYAWGVFVATYGLDSIMRACNQY
jgi:hypothetical protein